MFIGRIHTAVKIAPKYSQPTVHVLDASKSVVVVSDHFMGFSCREKICIYGAYICYAQSTDSDHPQILLRNIGSSLCPEILGSHTQTSNTVRTVDIAVNATQTSTTRTLWTMELYSSATCRQTLDGSLYCADH